MITAPTSVGLGSQTAKAFLAPSTGPITIVLASPLGPFLFISSNSFFSRLPRPQTEAQTHLRSAQVGWRDVEGQRQ